MKNAAGVIVDCTEPSLTTPTTANEVTVTINPGAPHVYSITFTGFVGTTAAGSCPPGTTLTQNVVVSPPGAAVPVTGPACAFAVTAFKKYIEGTSLTIVPLGPCGEASPPGLFSITGGTPCFFEVIAKGTIILKQGVNCSDGSEPATGTSAVPSGFPPGSIYQCINSTLTVVNVPVPRAVINLGATNGFFAPTCIPQARKPGPAGTPTPSPTPIFGPTLTPTRTPTPTATPTATAFLGGTGTPTPISQVPGSAAPSFCGPPGTSTTQVVTNELGVAGAVGLQAEYYAMAEPPFPPQFTNETIVGHFAIDGVGVAGAHMFATLHYQSGDTFCDSGVTDSTGTATCTTPIGNATLGYTVHVDVTFIYNCTEYATTTSFTPTGPGTPTPTATPGPPPPIVMTAPAPNGICVVRANLGELAVTASFATTINSQPALSTGPVVLGEFIAGTPTSTPTSTPVVTPVTPTPTNTPVPTPTNTPVPTPTPTPTNTPIPPTPTPTPTRTPTPTATPVPPLRFSLDAARVAPATSPGNRTGIDVVTPGQRVALVMYYTIRSLPRRLNSVRTYEILFGASTVFRVSFPGPVAPPGDLGPKARFTIVTVPTGLQFGVYLFRATLTIDGKTQRRYWRFAIQKRLPTVLLSGDVVVRNGAPGTSPGLHWSPALRVQVTHRFHSVARM